MYRASITTLAFLLAGLPLAAQAQGGPPPGVAASAERDTVTVGLGVGVTTSFDGSDDYKIIPGGVLRGTVSGHDFQINGPRLFIDVIPNDRSRTVDFELGPVAGIRSNRTGNLSNDQVEALGELDTAIEIGARASVAKRGVLNRADSLGVSVTGLWDVAGAHDSYVLTPSLEYSTVVGRRTFVQMAISAEFVGEKYADYNFGITPQGSAASGLATYNPDKGGHAGIGASMLATYSLSGGRTGWGLFGIVSYKRLQGDIADSPIVRDAGSADQFFGSAGLAYTF